MKQYKCDGFPSTILPDSKILILGTLPPYGRNWYYEEDELMWKILETATNDYKSGDTEESRKQFLERNKIALWDVFAYGERINSKSRDSSIIEKPNNKNLPEDEQNPKPNKIWDNLQNVEVIIIKGSSSAFNWFRDYNIKDSLIFEKDNNEPVCKIGKKEIEVYKWNNKIKVYSFYATSCLSRKQNKNYPQAEWEDIKKQWKEKWIKTIQKHLNSNSNNKPKMIVIKKSKNN